METKPVISPAAIVGGIIGTVACCICMGACLCVYAQDEGLVGKPGYRQVAVAEDSEFGLADDDEDALPDAKL